MNNRDIGTTLDEIADLLEFQNANPFRVRAYRNAARRVKDLSEPLAAITADPNRELTEIEGIGKDLAQKIAELLSTGEIEMLTQLRAEIPGGVLAMVRIPGMGPKKAALLRKELGINSLDELRGLRNRSRSGTKRLRQENARKNSGGYRSCRSRPRTNLLGSRR